MKHKIVIVAHADPGRELSPGSNPAILEKPGVYRIGVKAGYLLGKTKWGRTVLIVKLEDVASAQIESVT